ncbi:MAG: M24 family metallopeptidase [Ignavibacteriaceae bacterium]|nr:M24 family metallopeptidase [Ignavibacteriaceae bacterium]
MGKFNLNKIQEIINKMNLDGWLLYDFRGSNDVALDILDIPRESHLTRRFYYYIPKSGTPSKIVNAIEAYHLDHLPGLKLKYSNHTSLSNHLSETLKNARLIAMEYSPLNAIPYVSKIDAGTLEQIKSYGVEVVTSGDLISLFAAVWDEAQYLDNIPVANAMTDIVKDAFNLIKKKILTAGVTNEYEIQKFINDEFDKRGYITEPPIIVGVNENSGNPHYGPSEEEFKEIKKGDFVLIDLWAKSKLPNAVYADITWTGFVGETVPEKYVRIFNIVAEARDTAFNLVESRFKEGKEIRGYEVDDAARNVITKAGYGEYYFHRTGHSITTDIHGSGAHMDNYETRDERLLLPSTSFSIEPGIYLPEFGVRSEIDVFVKPNGEVIATGGARQNEIVVILK